MNINYKISPYPALHENMVAKVYEVDVSGGVTEVDSLTILEKNGSGVPTVGAGHQVPNAISFNGLDKLTHEVRLYTASGTLLHKYQREPIDDIITIFDPIRFKIGDGGTHTPAVGSNSFTHPDMAGLLPTEYVVQRSGVGLCTEGIEIADNGSGFDLFEVGDKFGANESFLITRNNQVVQNIVNDSVVGKQFGPTIGNPQIYVDITSNVSYDPSVHLRKLIRMSGSGAKFHFGITPAPPVGYIFRFTNVGAYSLITDTPIVYFDNAPLINGNTTAANFSLPFGSTCEFIFDGTNWNKSIIEVGVPNPATALTIEGRGLFNIGDVPGGGGTGWLINHGLNITGDYLVFLSVKSNNTADHSKDLKVSVAWWHDTVDKPNNFYLGAAELTGVVQNAAIAWMIVKI